MIVTEKLNSNKLVNLDKNINNANGDKHKEIGRLYSLNEGGKNSSSQMGGHATFKEVNITKKMLDEDLKRAKNEARKILDSDGAYLVMKQKFFAQISTVMKKNITTDVPYAAVNVINSISQLYINPLTYPKLEKKHRIAILIHEILHLTLMHVFRFMDLPKDEQHHYFWNLATDCAINQMVPKTYEIELPDWVYFPETFKQYGIDMPPGLSADDYYRILLDNKDKVPDDMNGGGGQGDGKSDSGNGSTQDNQSGQSQSGQSQGGENKDGGEQPQKYQNWHKKWGESEGSRKINEAAVKNTIRNAYRREPGSVPGNLKRAIEEIIESKVPWDRKFQQIYGKYLRANFVRTNKRESRRLGELAKGRRTNRKLSVAVIADTSASITNENLAQFSGHIMKIWKNGVKVTVIEADAAITDIYEFKGKINRVNYSGGGGTSFIPPFEHIEKTKMEVDLVIYLTDGYGDAPDKFNIPTIWCLIPEGVVPDAVSGGKVTWGDVIEMN